MTAAPHQPGSLSGRSVLVVEDEFFQAKDLAQALANAGARLVGPFPSLKTAMEALEEEPSVDVAVLDINLRGRAVARSMRWRTCWPNAESPSCSPLAMMSTWCLQSTRGGRFLPSPSASKACWPRWQACAARRQERADSSRRDNCPRSIGFSAGGPAHRRGK